MAATKHTTRIARLQKTKTNEPQALTHIEVKRLAEKLGVALGGDTETTQLTVLLLQHLWNVREDASMFWCALHSIETELYITTPEADEARREFRNGAYKDRANILAWPNERKVSA